MDGAGRHLQKFPCTSAKILAKNFSASVLTIGQILKNHLGLQKFPRRWVHYELNDDQKQLKYEFSEGLLNALRDDESA
jgi:hypothetical protein